MTFDAPSRLLNTSLCRMLREHPTIVLGAASAVGDGYVRRAPMRGAAADPLVFLG